MRNTSKAENAPTPWMLDGDAPAPQRLEEPKPLTDAERKRLSPADSHTGTDPLGRAIGPAENHQEVKSVIDPVSGEVETPNRKTGLTPSTAKALAPAKAKD